MTKKELMAPNVSCSSMHSNTINTELSIPATVPYNSIGNSAASHRELSIVGAKQSNSVVSSIEQNRPAGVKRPSLELFTECLENPLFMDYFNKYLCLPVFGQLLYFDIRMESFQAFPDVNSATWYMHQPLIIEWLYDHRFTRYLSTKLYLEYKLCETLCSVDYFRHQDSNVEEAFEFLQLRFLRGVSKMKQFRQFLQDQPASTTHVMSSNATGDKLNNSSSRTANGQMLYCTGYIIYNFWLDAKQLQHDIENNSTMWYTLFIGMRDKYSHYASSLRLPRHLLQHHSLKCWDTEGIIRAAKVFERHLQYYWVPRYLLQVKEDGIDGADIALFSLARKHLCVKHPKDYPFCGGVEPTIEEQLDEHDATLEAIIQRQRMKTANALGYSTSNAPSTGDLRLPPSLQMHSPNDIPDAASQSTVFSMVNSQRGLSTTRSRYSSCASDADTFLSSQRSSLASEVDISRDDRLRIQESLSKMTKKWMRRAKQRKRRRSTRELQVQEVFNLELCQDPEVQPYTPEKEEEVIRESVPKKTTFIVDDSSIIPNKQCTRYIAPRKTLGPEDSIPPMNQRRKSIVVVDENQDYSDDFSEDSESFSIDSDWTLDTSFGSEASGVTSEGSTMRKRSESLMRGSARDLTKCTSRNKFKKVRSSTSLKSDRSDEEAPRLTALQANIRAHLERKARCVSVDFSPEPSPYGSKRHSFSKMKDDSSGNNLDDKINPEINITKVDSISTVDAEESKRQAMDAAIETRRLKFGCIRDPMSNSRKSSLETGSELASATESMATGQLEETSRSSLPERRVSLNIPTANNPNGCGLDKSAARARDERARRRSSVARQPRFDAIAEEDNVSMHNTETQRNTAENGITAQQRPSVPVSGTDLTQILTKVASTVNNSIRGSLHGSVDRSQMDIPTHKDKPSAQPSLLAQAGPSFATSGIEHFLRGFISSASVLHRDTSMVQSAARSMNKMDIMKTKSPLDNNASSNAITVVSSKHRSRRMSNGKFSKASLASINSMMLSSSESDRDVVSTTLNEVGKTEAKRIRQVRKTATFAFNLTDLAPQDSSDGSSAEEVDDAKAKTTDKKSKEKKKSKPVTIQLDRDAINRANRAAATDRRQSWSNNTSKKRRSGTTKPTKKADPKRNSRCSRGRSTVGADLDGLLGFQQGLITNSISYEEDRDWRVQNQLIVQAFQTDEHAAYPFRQWLYEEECFTQLSLLAAWVDLDRLRSYEQLGSELRSHAQYSAYCKNLLKHCLHNQEGGVMNYVSPVLGRMLKEIDCDRIYDIPIACIKLQRDIFAELAGYYQTYVRKETKSFRIMTCTKRRGKSISGRRVSFSADVFEEEEVGQDDFLMTNYNTNIKGRMGRSSKLTIDLSQIHKYDKFSREFDAELSDENGDCRREPVKQVFRAKKKLTVEEMYNNVKVEYPVTGYKYTHTEINTSDDYLRPIRKQGNLIHRPTQRPKSIKDILKNQIHFEFFRRYLKYNNVDKMLVFWKSIEIMKNTVNIRQRQVKAQNIMEKFFHDPDKKPCELLFCNAPIIMEIPGLEIVTTSMLFSAQRTILHQMEVDWFNSYLETFPKETEVATETKGDATKEAVMTGNSLITKGLRAAIAAQNPALFDKKEHKGQGKHHFNPLVADSGSIRRTWRALCDWFKAAAKFIRCMDNKHDYHLFHQFLAGVATKGVPGTVTDSDGNQVSSDTAVNKEQKKPIPAKQIICGQLVTLMNLPNDLHFWLETDKFKGMWSDEEITKISEGNFNINNLILKKASVLTDCFLECRTVPLMKDGVGVTDSQLNVPRDLCEQIIVSIRSGIIDNTIFSDAASYVFPILVHFWKIYREEYVKVTYKRWMDLTDDIKVALKQMKMNKQERWNAPRRVMAPANKSRKLDISSVNKQMKAVPSTKSLSQLKLPIFMSQIEQIQQLPVPKYQAKRADEGAGDSTEGGSKITFSVNEGVILHVPADSFTMKAIHNYGSNLMQEKIIKPEQKIPVKKAPRKSAAKKEKPEKPLAKRWEVVVEDESMDENDSSVSINRKRKRSGKKKKPKKVEEEEDESAKEESKQDLELKFKQEMKRRDQEAQMAFEKAERRLRACIRAQVKERKKFMPKIYH